MLGKVMDNSRVDDEQKDDHCRYVKYKYWGPRAALFGMQFPVQSWGSKLRCNNQHKVYHKAGSFLKVIDGITSVVREGQLMTSGCRQ